MDRAGSGVQRVHGETFQHGARVGSGRRGSVWRHSNMARVGSGVRRVHMETFQHGQGGQWGAEGPHEASQQGARAGSRCRGSCQEREVGTVKCNLCLVPRAADVPVGPTAGI